MGLGEACPRLEERVPRPFVLAAPEDGISPLSSGGGEAQTELGEKELVRVRLGFRSPRPAEFPALGVCWKNVV